MGAATVLRGIILVMGGIVILLLDITVLGTILDNFVFTMSNIMGTPNPLFIPTMNIMNTLVVWFYRLPLILAILLVVWGFKLIFVSHPYTYPTEGMRW
jgi:hypothetical protein